MELSKNWKLVITQSKLRIVHARGCDYIKDWNASGLTELTKVKPNKNNICKCCEYLVYLTIGAKDYNENLKTYKRIFKDVPVTMLKELFVTKRAKCSITGHRVYFTIKEDTFYVDFEYDDIHLYHNNYKVLKREQGEESFVSGYHEHKIETNSEFPTMSDAIRYLNFYDYKKAKSSHIKTRKKKPKMLLSEYDPELYGFTDN